ncbi:MAG: hypothetical protein RIE31_08660 [Alphaproteobacteria bacterium]
MSEAADTTDQKPAPRDISVARWLGNGPMPASVFDDFDGDGKPGTARRAPGSHPTRYGNSGPGPVVWAVFAVGLVAAGKIIGLVPLNGGRLLLVMLLAGIGLALGVGLVRRAGGPPPQYNLQSYRQQQRRSLYVRAGGARAGLAAMAAPPPPSPHEPTAPAAVPVMNDPQPGATTVNTRKTKSFRAGSVIRRG